jgi:hypothetical protein
MCPPSSNALVTGLDFIRAFRGVTEQAGKVGSRVLFLSDQSYAGLGTASVAGNGSVFAARQLLLYVGAGQVQFDGANISGAIASSVLSLVKKSGGVYAAGSLTGPFQAGHAQPSAPVIFAKTSPSAGKTPMSGVVTVVIWRVSGITGQVSLRSLPSNELSLSGHSVIVQMPLTDLNGQDMWGIGVVKVEFADLGVYYQLPTSLGGEVSEASLAYTRTVTGASIADTTNVVDITDPDPADQFTSADVGRRIAFGAFDSFIIGVNSATQVEVNDTNSSGGTISGTATVTHAVDGVTRAVEISWANGSLIGQELAPEKAFPPPAGQFAGAINDVLWLEADGIIYVGEPGYIGSFPPSNALFPNEPAVHYLRTSEGYLRFCKNSIGALGYVGGSPALEFQTLLENQGIKYPQNVALGLNGRLLAWLGKPSVFAASLDPETEFARKVMPDFDGWEAQGPDDPVCPGADPAGQYEVWCWRKKVMALHVPSGLWCSPVQLDTLPGYIMATVTHENRLYLSVKDGLTLKLYLFDAGAGSLMVVQTSDVLAPGTFADLTRVELSGRVDDHAQPVTVAVVKDFNNTSPQLVKAVDPPANGAQIFETLEPNLIALKAHAVRVSVQSAGGDCGIDFIRTAGSVSHAVL